MTNLYRMTWQKKNDNDAPIVIGPVLWHRKVNPHWAKENAPYTHREALAASKRWDRICPTHKHKIIPVSITQKEEIHNENVSTFN